MKDNRDGEYAPRACSAFDKSKVNILTTNLNMELADKHIGAGVEFEFPGVICDGKVAVTMGVYGNTSAAYQYIMEKYGSSLKSHILKTLTAEAKKHVDIKTIELTIVKISAERIIL